MILPFIVLGSFLLYGKSKYFPKEWSNIHRLLSQYKVLSRLIAYALIGLAAYNLTQLFDVATGLTICFFTTTMILSLMIISIPLHRNFLYLFIATTVVTLIAETRLLYQIL